MLLGSTSDKIQWRLGYAVTSTALDCTASYIDYVASSNTTTKNTQGSSSNNTTFVDAVSVPAASTKRHVRRLVFYNADTRPHIIFLKFENGTAYTEKTLQIGPGQTITYVSERDWSHLDGPSAVRALNKHTSPSYSGRRRNPGVTHTAGTNKTLTNGTTYAVYLGVADRDFSQVMIRWRQVAGATGAITWAEIAIATGAFAIRGNATLTRLGSAVSIAGQVPTGNTNYTTSVTGLSGTVGMELWMLFGIQAATSPGTIRGTVADIVGGGHQQEAAATQPSAMSGATAFTVEGTTIQGIQCDFRLIP